MRRTPENPAISQPATAGLTAISWLGSDQHGADVLTTARLLISMEQAAGKALPGELARVFRVARIDRQQITLAVPSAAHAAKLRQLTPRIIRLLVQNGWNLNEIIVKVQADLLQAGTKTTAARTAAPLGDEALQAFRDLHGSLAPGPLADAVARLLARHAPP